MSLCQPDKVADSHNLMVVLAHLQGVAATFRVGRHHHRGPLHEGRGLTHALTHTAPTDLTVAAALVRKAYSKRRRSCLWSKPVNLRTWRLVSDPIAMVQALAELRYGVVVHTRENSLKYGLNFNQTPYLTLDMAHAITCHRFNQGSSSFGTALNRVSRCQKHATEAKVLATRKMTSMLVTMMFRTRNVFTGLRK